MDVSPYEIKTSGNNTTTKTRKVRHFQAKKNSVNRCGIRVYDNFHGANLSHFSSFGGSVSEQKHNAYCRENGAAGKPAG